MKSVKEMTQYGIPADVLSLAFKIGQGPHVNVSFSKGSLDRFLTISGIVTEDKKAYHSRVSLRDKENKLKTACDCPYWNLEEHCAHSLALLEHHFSQKNVEQMAKTSSPDLLFSHLTYTKKGTHPTEYGLIVKDFKNLPGASTALDFIKGNYILTNGKIKNFPHEKKELKSINIDFISGKSVSDFQFILHADTKYLPKFSIVTPDNEVKTKISLFWGIGFFDWISGEIYRVEDDFFKSIIFYKDNTPLLSAEEHISLLPEGIELSLEGKPIRDLSVEELNFSYSLKTQKSETQARIELLITDSNDKGYHLPSYLQLFTQTGGILEKITLKKDAHQFIKNLSEHWEHFEKDQLTEKAYLPGKLRSSYSALKKGLFTKEKALVFNASKDHLGSISTQTIKDLLRVFSNFLGEFSLRSSSLSSDGLRWVIYLPNEEAIDLSVQIINELKSTNTKFFYNNSNFNYWKPDITFQRDSSRLDWFDFNISMKDTDIDYLKNYDPSKGYIYNRGELIFLDQNQKSLYRFLKKVVNNKALPSGDSKQIKLSYNRSQIFELLDFYQMGFKDILTPEEVEICQKLENLESLPVYDVPEINNASPREYQEEGFRWLNFLFENRFGACLADDMGLGKTLQAILLIKSLYEKVEKILIISPVSIIANWENEIIRFSGIEPSVYYGPDRSLDIENSKLIITSYGILKREIDSPLGLQDYDLVIFDEIQHLKNPKSLGAKAARKLKTKFRLALTGTPVENDISEFYNILDLSLPGIWGQTKITSKEQRKLVAKKFAKPFILRRTKKQVLTELPDKVESLVYLDFSQQERLKYDNSLKKIQEEIFTAQKSDVSVLALKNLLQLRQLCLWQLQAELFSTKVDYLIESLEQILQQDDKVLIFSQFTKYLDIIQKRIEEKNYLYSRIDGSYSLNKRVKQIEQFQKGNNNIFLISLKAGGQGLNLTEANYIFLMDPWWNPAVENQAIDRAYRIGQKKKVTVYRPIIKNSIEEKVLVLQEKKKELFKDLLGDNEESEYTGKLTKDDFLYLLGKGE